MMGGMAAEDPSPVHAADHRALRSDAALTRVERALVVALVVVMLTFSVVTMTSSASFDPVASVFDLLLTCLFVGFLFIPSSTAATFVLAIAVSFFLDLSAEALIPGTIAAALVVRTCRLWVIVGYAGALGIAIAVVGLLAPNEETTTRIAIYLLLMITAATVGLVLRLAGHRERRLEERLRQQARDEEQVRRAERLRIADELHDVVAHDLTAIAMQARLLERQSDPGELQETRQAISEAARRALVEMRSVIDQAAVPNAVPPSMAGGFAQTVAEVRDELAAAGRTVTLDVDPAVYELPRLLTATLAGMLRESVTNMLKHSVSDYAVIDAHIVDGHVETTVRNRFDGRRPALRLPSGGYGTVRMSERVQLLGGEFAAGVEGGEWVAGMRVPLP